MKGENFTNNIETTLERKQRKLREFIESIKEDDLSTLFEEYNPADWDSHENYINMLTKYLDFERDEIELGEKKWEIDSFKDFVKTIESGKKIKLSDIPPYFKV